MAHFALVFVLFVISVQGRKKDADPGLRCVLNEGVRKLLGSVQKLAQCPMDPPTNKNSSIRYRVYTRNHAKDPCFLEPTEEALKNCPIDSAYPTMFLIHGLLVDMNRGNLFEETKDVLLEREAMNVIIVDWSKYDKPPYLLAIENLYIIAGEVAELIKFLAEYAGIQTRNLTLTGHSLGAHLSGAVGKKLKNLGRINGLDPAGPLFDTLPLSRLSYTDADFVQVMHTSDTTSGLGLYESLGHMDFYVNNRIQPHCKHGSRFQRVSGGFAKVHDDITFRFCNHEIAMQYFINTINSTDCKFLGTKCDSYDKFREGKCPPQNSEVGEMGAYGSKIPGLPPHSNFYLRTGSESPYCLKNGSLP